MKDGTWSLRGYDTFAREYYGLDGAFDSEDEAIEAAMQRLHDLEVRQPSASSGGQDGIQDRVFVIRPDRTMYRVAP